MYVLIISTDGRPDFWQYKGYEIDQLLADRDEKRLEGKDPLIIHIDLLSQQVNSVLDGYEITGE